MVDPSSISTPRFVLRVLVPEQIQALVRGDTWRAGRLLGAHFPQGWPHDSEAREGLLWHLSRLRSDRSQLSWRVRAIIEREQLLVVGSVTCKGPPDAFGDVEFGWGINEPLRGRGYGFEATSALTLWVSQQPHVKSLSATIWEHNTASQCLARKLGMRRTGELRRRLPLWRRPALPARRYDLPQQQERQQQKPAKEPALDLRGRF